LVQSTPGSGGITGNRASVAPSAGTSGDTVWAGFAIGTIALATTAPSIEEYTIPAASPYTITSLNTPLTASTATSVWVASGSTVDTPGNAYTYTTDYTVSGAVWTFGSTHAGATVLLVYNYTLSASVAELLFGDSYTLGAITPSARTGTIGVIDQGLIYTTYFDPSVNWNAAATGALKTGASGVVTLGGNGMTIPGAMVWESPSVNYPWLGLKI